MENFIVSARKYRPDSFETVVAQASITGTLKNAIKSKQLAHAYLFCGPRGVGKTTCARIFAKTINCTNLTADTEACNECESCKSFNTSRSFNIHELDAASNNSVDDIRNLTDQVRVPPQMGKYSVYIIDEVHMLSSQAFNAFLKTLEEPPKHAIFILATTEKHKIIPTILSRCQIFDFNRIGVSDISNHLTYVAKSEDVEAEPEGLNVIAQKADGAMRDALSIFDQIVSFSGKKITYQDVITNLNVLDYDYHFRLVDEFLKNNVTEVLIIFNDILNHGFDGHHFITGLSSHLRDILVCKDAVTVQLLEVGGDIKERYKTQAAACNSDFLLDAMQIANDCDLNYKTSQNKRLLIELALIRIAQLTLKKKIADTEDDILEPIFTGQDIPEEKIAQKPAVAKPVVQKAVVQEPEVAKPKPQRRVLKRGSQSMGTPSIKRAMRGEFEDNTQLSAKEQHELYSKEGEVEPFTSDQLKEKWDLFLTRLEDGSNMKVTLANVPKIEENFSLLLEIDNRIQDELIANIRPELVSFLRKELRNSKINLKTLITEVVREKVIYSDIERYQALAVKNPNLAYLKQTLNLDF
ncbi:DNA polymerase III subunit gamma/tau [Maribellus sediminis]|uniref:DNA polymerase III subunit gamma/tau n=1 Tax=Maribellus sediminis TaxID=2696285 RepID=UPI001430B211|nr:DNA polymerase III subunit gamma/tau [Maribellus sediminis]